MPFRRVQESRINSELNGKHQLLVCADDVDMLRGNLRTVRENTKIFIKESKENGFEVNCEETKYIITSRHQNVIQNQNIVIGNLLFENVEKFRYLGVTVTNTNDIREEIKHRIKLEDACYYSLEKILSSCLLSKKFKTYKTIILPTVLYSCETWSLTLREEHRLRVFENKVLRKISGAKKDEITGEWRKLHNTDALYSSPNMIKNL